MLVFLCSPISHSSYNQLHLPVFPILPALLGCHSKSGQVWPHGVETIFSKLSCRHCNQGELLSGYIWGGSHWHVPDWKQGHSYFTYLWNQLKVIDVLNDRAEVSCTAVAIQKSSDGPAPCVPFPSSGLWGWGHPIYIFLIFPGYLEFWTPITNPYLGPSSCLHPVTILNFTIFEVANVSY